MSAHAPVCDHPLYNYQPAWANRGAAVGHVTRHADLSVTPAALWSVLADPRTWADWLTVHNRWVAEPRMKFVPGARMTAETLMLGIANTVEWTVESAIAPGTLVLIGTGTAGLRTRFTFLVSPTDEGSRLTITSEVAGELLNDDLIAVIEADGAEQLDRSIEQLEELAGAAPERVAALRLVHSAPEIRDEPRRPRWTAETHLKMVR